METFSTQINLLTKLTHIYLIMPFYNYAYDSVKLIRSLCQNSRNLWFNDQDAIIRMFTKQLISFGNQRIDAKTIDVLKRGDRYKLFKYSIRIDGNNQERIQMFFNMLDQIPQFEIERICLTSRCNKDFIDMLLQKSVYKTRHELYKVLDVYGGLLDDESYPYEYLSKVY